MAKPLRLQQVKAVLADRGARFVFLANRWRCAETPDRAPSMPTHAATRTFVRMTLDAHTVAGAFVNFTLGSEGDLRELIADDCFDHVSGRKGKDIWGTVSTWLRQSFADIEVELHAVGHADGGRVMIWMTTHGTHVGSAFPWMRGQPATGRRIAWSQLHVFREEKGRLVEHWAVRDDLRVLEAIEGA